MIGKKRLRAGACTHPMEQIQLDLCKTEKARRVILRLEALDRERGYDQELANGASGDRLRLIDIDDRRRGAVLTAKAYAGVASSKSGRVRAVRNAPTIPTKTVQIWENGDLVFAGQTIKRKFRVLQYVEGDWEQMLIQ